MSAEDAAKWVRQCAALHGTPVKLQRELERCKHVSQWGKAQVLRRWNWAIDSYIDGYISKPAIDIETATFIEEAASLISTDDLIVHLQAAADAASRPLTGLELTRRDEWLRSEAQRREQMEARRQRRLLREGHDTMKAIRRVLRGQDQLPRQESTPARSSQT